MLTLFEKLLLSHLVGDWLLQPHWMAIRKTGEWKVRAIHCAIVTSCFWWVGIWWCLWIYATHFIIDTYKPLYWFRKLRGDFKSWEEFKESFSTPAGFMVNVVFDQIFHILMLLPIILS